MNLKKISAIFIGISCIFGSAAGCSSQPGLTEKIDPTRTQIYVYNFDGGYGSEWLASLKQRFEEYCKDDSWEEGKKGVQIFVNNQKTVAAALETQLFDNRDEVYFIEHAYYYDLYSKGLLLDLTEALTTPLTEYGETKSIVDKMFPEQQAFYGIQGDTTKWYGIPHYAGYSGITYNKDLFDDEGYYFAADPWSDALEDQFISRQNPTKSAGPDGTSGTSDDGLPATYEQFYQLCNFIASNAQTPIVWSGRNYTDYGSNVLQALVTDYEGKDQMMLNYNFGTGDVKQATDLGTIQNGQFVLDEEPTTITEENGYELSRQAGKYYGLEFMEKLMTTADWQVDLAFNTAYSHMNAQEDFLYAGNDGVTDDIAMLLDGCWWQMEAEQTFQDMVNAKGESYSKNSRQFAFMPLPKANEEEVAEAAERVRNGENPYTLYDHLYSLCFVKANVAEWKIPLIEKFIRFAHTDESLSEFTKVTDTMKALDYTVSEEDRAEMTPYGLSLMEYQQRADIVYPYSMAEKYINNQRSFVTDSAYTAIVDGRVQSWPTQAFHEGVANASEYFEGLFGSWSSKWSTLI